MEWINSIRSLYRNSRRTLLYIDLLFIVVLFYAGKYFTLLRDQLLPAAIASAFLILLEALFAISDSLQDKIGIIAVHEHLPGSAQNGPTCFLRAIIVSIRSRLLLPRAGPTINTIIPTLVCAPGKPNRA